MTFLEMTVEKEKLIAGFMLCKISFFISYENIFS